MPMDVSSTLERPKIPKEIDIPAPVKLAARRSNPEPGNNGGDDGDAPETLKEDDALPPVNKLDPKRVDEDTISYTFNGKTYYVNREDTPFKYNVLEGKLLGTEIDKSDNNINVNVPESSTTDFMNAKTTEDGKTVGELFHENMKKEWGDLSLDDPRRQYFELMEAKSALATGYHVVPYQTRDGAFGSTVTTSLDSTSPLDQASTYGLLKEEEIAKKLAELSERPEIVEGVDKLMNDAVSKIEDRRGLTNKVFDTMSSDEYMDMLESLDPEVAKVRFANDLKSLDFLDKNKASEIRNKFLDEGLVDEFTKIMESGEFDKEAIELAASDTVQKALQATFMSAFGITFSDMAVQNYLKDGSGNLPDDVKRGLDSYKVAVNVATTAFTDSFKANGKFDLADVTKRLSQGILAADNLPTSSTSVRNGAAALLNGAIMNGALPAAGGILAGVATIYTLNKNGGDTLEERMGAARTALIVIATSPALVKAGSKVVESFFNKPGMTAMLGLEDNTQLREAFEKKFGEAAKSAELPTPPESPTRPGSPGSPGFGLDLGDMGIELDDWSRDLLGDINRAGSGENGFSDTMRNMNVGLDDASDAATRPIADALDNADPADRASLMNMIDDRVQSMGVDPSDLDTPSKLRIIGTIMTTVGGLADTVGGILDIALGGMSLDKLRKDPDAMPDEIAGATFQLLGGISIAGMAGTSLASMLAGPATAATMGVAAGAMGIAGLVFGGISAIIAGVVAKKKQDQAMDNVRQDFNDWSKLGITEHDWGDKLNYAIHIAYEYNSRKGSSKYYDLYPEDKPVWEGRRKQYEAFTEYVSKHGKMHDDWFKDWDKEELGENVSNWGDSFGSEDPSGLPRFGDAGKPGSFEEFKRDVDRVDVGSIELAENGRVIFRKDGVKQIIDPQIGEKASDKDRRDIINYLKDLHQITHPGGKRDQDIIDRIAKLHDESDRYNEISDLKRILDDSKPPLFGKDGNTKVGTFSDFKRDIDRVDIASIRPDSGDSSVIYFEKDGQEWMLDKDDHGSLKKGDAEKIFDYLNNLYVMTHSGGKPDQDLIDRIEGLFGKSDDHNDLDDLRDEIGADKDPTGLPVFGDGGKPGTFKDFRRDIDRVDIGSIELADGGRVIFKKDGVLQVINPSDGDKAGRDTRRDIIRYLEGLYHLARPDGDLDKDRVDMMNDIFRRTDKYNDLDAIRDKIEMEESADGLPFFGDGGKPGKFGDFKEDIDRVDIGSIELLDNGNVIFTKDGVMQVVSVTHGSDSDKKTREQIINYLKEMHNIAHPDGKFDRGIAERMDWVLGANDKHNDPDKIGDYIDEWIRKGRPKEKDRKKW
ncbi:hypothetical protein [Paracoccus sp. TOH]|uniref:hypothetical protein n=1 Tax=Paracoccus sp. TOH TaxID=1263728 RepID=UPI0025B27711|nr:hypothetical protein [Paracoccus sp. TOH]WJS87413.1 hypothetical protein NBE95_21525 [Paracoccus sp. TOH]